MIRSKLAIAAVLAVLAIAGLALPAAAQPWKGVGTLGLEVKAGRRDPLEGAEVRVRYAEIDPIDGPPPLTTGADGRIEVQGLAAGRWRVDISKEGYSSYLLVVAVESHGETRIVSGPVRDATGDRMRIELFEVTPTALPGPVLRIPPEARPRERPREPEPAPPARPEPAPARPEPTPARPEPAPAPSEPEPAEPERMAEPVAPPEPEAVAEPPAPAAEPEPEAPEPAPVAPAEEPGPVPEPEEVPAPTPATAPAPEPPPAEPEPAAPVAPAEEPGPVPEPEEMPPPEAAAAPEPPAPSEAAPAEEPEPEEAPQPPTPSPQRPPERPVPPAAEAPPPSPAPPAAEPRPAPPPAAEAPPTAPSEQPAPVPSPPSPARPSAPPAQSPPLPRISATVTSAAEGTCPQCQPGQSAVMVEQLVGASGLAPAEDCVSDLAERLDRIAALLADAGVTEAGPLISGTGGALQHLRGTSAANEVATLVTPFLRRDSSCQALVVVLPPGAGYAAYSYEASDAFGSGSCNAGEECAIGSASWSGEPTVVHAEGLTIVYGVFRNASQGRQRRAVMTVYFEP